MHILSYSLTIFIPPVYEVYRGYIVFAFSVCLCVCKLLYNPVCVGPGRYPEDRFSHNEAHMSRDVRKRVFGVSDSVPY